MHNIPLNPWNPAGRERRWVALMLKRMQWAAFGVPLMCQWWSQLITICFFGTLVTCDIVKRNYDILMTKTVLTTKTWSYHGNTLAFCSFWQTLHCRFLVVNMHFCLCIIPCPHRSSIDPSLISKMQTSALRFALGRCRLWLQQFWLVRRNSYRLRPGMVAMVEVGFQICMKFPKLWTKSWM